jgi:hypothetical protein
MGPNLVLSACFLGGKMLTKVMPLLLILSAVMGSYAHAEPEADYSFSFSTPNHGHIKGEPNPCLRDRFPAGTKVVLVSQEGTYSARIAGNCTWSDRLGSHQGSELEDARGFIVAVVGVPIEAVRVVPWKEDSSPLSQETESEVLRVLTESFRRENPHWPQREFKFSRDIFRAGQAGLLRVSYDCGFMGRANAPVLVVNNNILPLPGTFDRIFFSVNGKPHLACFWTSPQSSESSRAYPRVYDLSGKTPRMVWRHAHDGGGLCVQ